MLFSANTFTYGTNDLTPSLDIPLTLALLSTNARAYSAPSTLPPLVKSFDAAAIFGSTSFDSINVPVIWSNSCPFDISIFLIGTKLLSYHLFRYISSISESVIGNSSASTNCIFSFMNL